MGNSIGRVMDWRAELDALAGALEQSGGEGWLVGGCLRNALLGEPVADVDVALRSELLPLAERMARTLPLALARLGHDTIRLVARRSPDAHLDLTPLHGGDIISDLARRDFTANAMALPLAARDAWFAVIKGDQREMPDLLDPFGGRKDLLARRLVAVGPSVFRDEPGRIIRAGRMRARYHLSPDAEALQLAGEAVPLLATLSPDRVRDETALLLAAPGATEGIELLHAVGALAAISPCMGDDRVAHHALATLRQLDLLMGISHAVAVYPALHAWAGSDSRRIAVRRLGLLHACDSHDEHDTAPGSVLWRRARRVLEFEGATERLHAARLLFASVGRDEATAADALLVAVACVLGGDDQRRGNDLAPRADEVIERYLNRRVSLIPSPLVLGKDLIELLSIPPGPAIGNLLHAVRQAQLVDEIATREEAVAFVRRLHESDAG